MVNYKETVEQIKSQLTKGDIEAIVNKAGYSRQVFMTATKKEDWSDLTNGEQGVIDAAIEYLISRKEVRQRAEQL